MYNVDWFDTRNLKAFILFIVYIDMGAGGSDTGTIMFSFDTTSTTSRKYDIKVAQIPCGTNYRYLIWLYAWGISGF